MKLSSVIMARIEQSSYEQARRAYVAAKLNYCALCAAIEHSLQFTQNGFYLSSVHLVRY
jgi:hypothetical protein